MMFILFFSFSRTACGSARTRPRSSTWNEIKGNYKTTSPIPGMKKRALKEYCFKREENHRRLFDNLPMI